MQRLHPEILGGVQPRQHLQGAAGEAGVGAAALADQQRHPRRLRGPAHAAIRGQRGLRQPLPAAGRGQAAPGAAPAAGGIRDFWDLWDLWSSGVHLPKKLV